MSKANLFRTVGISRLRIFFGPICESLKPSPPGGNKRNWSATKAVADIYAGRHVNALLLEDISPEIINRFLANRLSMDGWSPKTANLMRQVIHTLFAYAIKHHGFRSRDRRYFNPAAGVDRFSQPACQIRFLTTDDIPKQLAILEGHPVIHAMVAMYIYAGLRREEVLWLTNDDVDTKQWLVRVRAKTIDGLTWQPKTKYNRVVPISSALQEILRQYQPPVKCVWFFPSPTGKRWNPDNFSQDLRKLNKAVGLDWSCLDFRHTLGSHLAQKGESLYKIAELLGNSPDICRRHYAALMPERMRDTVEFEKDMLISCTNTANIEAMLRQILDRVSKEEVQHQPKPSVEPLCP